MKPSILLSFDVEEFDIPLEYKQTISMKEQLEVGHRGLEMILPLLSGFKVPATMFTTANFAIHFPGDMKELAKEHEIGSHTFYHSSFENKHLLESRITLENISGAKVTGLRMPRMKAVDMNEVKKAGYEYDSSVNPTWLPGRYNNLHLPRTIYRENEITRIPASVTPGLRLPLFWLGFKNYPFSFFASMCKRCLKKDGYVCLYFHPWEFTMLGNYKLPRYVKNPDGRKLTERLKRLIEELGPYGSFMAIRDHVSLNKNHYKIPAYVPEN